MQRMARMVSTLLVLNACSLGHTSAPAQEPQVAHPLGACAEESNRVAAGDIFLLWAAILGLLWTVNQ
jgi:hypothetical protein